MVRDYLSLMAIAAVTFAAKVDTRTSFSGNTYSSGYVKITNICDRNLNRFGNSLKPDACYLMLDRRVPGDGRLDARIVVIGEAPGQREDAERKPFVGPAGWRWNEWLTKAGLRRADLRVENVVERRPPANKIEAIPKPELAAWVDDLHDRIAALTDPWVLVPMGNIALRALLGRKDAPITSARGFIESYTDRRGRPIKVIPSIHPAATFRTPSWERPCQLDWHRIAADSAFRELRVPAWEHFVTPTVSDLEQYVAHVAARPDAPLSIDIETWTGVVSMVGFACESAFSFTVPTTLDYWHVPATLAYVWQLIAALCALPNEKVLQTGNYDRYWLQMDHGIRVYNYRWDCHAMHHCLDATDDHDLGYMASVDLRCRGWKHIPKDDEAKSAHKDDATALRVYNGVDNVVQWQLADLYRQRLATRGKQAFYADHYVRLFDPLLHMMVTGIRTDDAKRRERFAAMLIEVRRTRDAAAAIAGRPLHSITGKRVVKISDNISAHKVKAYFYVALKLPAKIKRDTGKQTADEAAIRALMLKYPDKVGAVGEQILLHRRAKKISEFVSETRVDADGRMRSSYGFAPQTGRLSSSKNPKRGGGNGQNIDREIRSIFVPDEGHLFLEVDMSQAEDRIVKTLAASLLSPGTRRDELLWRARAQPWENDEHIRAAVVIFKIVAEAVSKAQRYIGKRARHAGNYDQHGTGLSEVLLKDGIIITPAEGERMIAAVIDEDTPEVRLYQREIRRRVMADRLLTNSWGRDLSFEWDRLDDEAYRRGYAFLPQSSVPAILNQYGHVPLYHWLMEQGAKARIVQNGHDSLLISTPLDEAWDIASFLHTALVRSVSYWGVELTIPIEMKVGRDWSFAGGQEWKRWPAWGEFDAVLRGMTG